MPADLHRAVAVHKELVERIRAAFPQETEENLADSIDGATQLDAAIISVIRAAIEREAYAKALGQLIDTMAQRRMRLVDGADALRRAAKDAMLEAGMHKLSAPDMTAGLRAGKPKVLVLDPSLIPDDFCEYERKIRKPLIGDALESGLAVPGASLANGETILTVRRS